MLFGRFGPFFKHFAHTHSNYTIKFNSLYIHAAANRRYHLQMATVRDWLKKGKERLVQHPAAALEAEVLLALAMRVSRPFLFAHPESEVPARAAETFAALLERRADGEPIAYITGEREFWSLPLWVTPAVLIPRPETELLVEAALARIPEDAPYCIADLGTGSGAIALALAGERPRCEIHATDVSRAALEVARANAARLRLDNVCFHQGSWFAPLSGTFDLVASNPPYVAMGDPHLSEGDLRFEPDGALVAGPGGLEALRSIAGQAPERLNPGGWLLLEHGHEQGAECRTLLESQGFESIETLTDLEGTNRVTLGRHNQPPAR